MAPTSPLVSGGAQLHVTPGKGMPSKLRPVPGIALGKCLVWRAASGRAMPLIGTCGLGFASWSGVGRIAMGRIERSGREVSFLTEWPTVTWLEDAEEDDEDAEDAVTA